MTLFVGARCYIFGLFGGIPRIDFIEQYQGLHLAYWPLAVCSSLFLALCICTSMYLKRILKDNTRVRLALARVTVIIKITLNQ
jgi:hypothetical protein